MNQPNKKMELLGSAPIPKALLALGLPTMTGMLINALYNLVDTYFVGGLGTDQMGAVTVAPWANRCRLRPALWKWCCCLSFKITGARGQRYRK